MRKGQDIVITRSHISGWAGFFGGAALLIGLLTLLWQGQLSGYALAALALGAAGVGFWAVTNPREFAGLVTGRQVRYGTLAVVSAFVLIAIVVVTYLVLARAAINVDMTENRRFSLSPASLELIDQITRDVQITGFYSPRVLRQREIDEQFFRLYETASEGRIRVVFIDPDEQPALAERFNVAEDAQVFVSFVSPEGEVDFNTLARVPRGTQQERDMTEALARLMISGTVRVYVDASPGALDPFSTGAEGISGIANGMRESGIVVNTLALGDLAAAGQTIPGDAAALILARPTSDLPAEQVTVLDEFLRRGGALLILTDALFNETPFMAQQGAFNAYLWDNYGIRAIDAVVVDPVASGETPLDIVGAAVFTGTDIGARLDPAERPVQFRIARVLQVRQPPEGVRNGQVVISSEGSYGETDLVALGDTNTYAYVEGQDLPGPHPTVLWAQNEATDARIVLVADSDFATNGRILTGGNGILFTDSMTWLTGFDDRINFGIQMYFSGLPLLFMDQQTLDRIAFVTAILMPGAMLVTGLAVWSRRKRR